MLAMSVISVSSSQQSSAEEEESENEDLQMRSTADQTTIAELQEQNVLVSKKLKLQDMQIAQKIASYAGMTLRDRHGNLSDDVWHAVNTVEDTTRLLDTATMRKMLLDQLSQHLEAHKDLLINSDSNDVLVQWIINFKKCWEAKIAEQNLLKFDISVKILTVMEEALLAVSDIMHEHGIPERKVSEVLLRSSADFMLYDTVHDTYVRYMFRNEIMRPQLCRVAGKLLQKQLVCNKSGAYSSVKQRNDVTQERDEAMMQLDNFLRENGGWAVQLFWSNLLSEKTRLLCHNHVPKPSPLPI